MGTAADFMFHPSLARWLSFSFRGFCLENGSTAARLDYQKHSAKPKPTVFETIVRAAGLPHLSFHGRKASSE